MSIQFGDILKHNNPNFPISDITDIKGGLRSIATFSETGLFLEYTSGANGSIIPEKYKSGYSLLLETSTNTMYYFSGLTATNTSDWTRVGLGSNGSGVTNSVVKWTGNSTLGTSTITDDGDTVTIYGNLMITGTTSTVNSENLLVKDPIILLAASQSGTPTFDSGLFINRGIGATQAFIWDESAEEFTFTSTTSGATVSGNVSIGTLTNVRTGVLRVGTVDIDSDDRLIVSTGQIPSLVVDDSGNTYNKSKGITNTLFGYGSQKDSLYDAGISINGIYSNPDYDLGTYNNVQMTLLAGPPATTYPIVNITVSNDENGDPNYISSIEIVTNGTGFTSNETLLTANFGNGTGFYVTITLAGLYNTSFGCNSLFSNSGSNNTAMGYSSLLSNTTGYSNVAIGLNSLLSNTTGFENVAIGVSASNLTTTGYQNIAIGHQSLFGNQYGYRNVAIGYQSLRSGYDSVAIGYQSLYSNTASYNIAIGSRSLYLNTSGTQNIAIGQNTLLNNTTGINNLAIGYNSLTSAISSSNVALGVGTLAANTTGNANTAVGVSTMQSTTTGNYNTGLGYSSLLQNTTGYENTSGGYHSLRQNTVGYQNTSFGVESLYNNTTGTSSVGVGYRALFKNNTGHSNTALGVESLRFNTTEISALAATFSAGSGYTPGTYSNIVLFGVSGTPFYPGGNTSDYPQATIVVGSGGTVSSVTLTFRGTVIPDETVILGIQTGIQPYQIPGSGFGFRVNIASIVRAGDHNVALGYRSLYELRTGSRNVALGSYAGSIYGYMNNTSDSVYIGYNTNPVSFNVTNEIVIGATATGNGSNTVTLGNNSILKTYLKGAIQLPTVPTTSSATYSILTRNDDTGEVEKIELNTQKTINGDTTLDNTYNGTIVKVKTTANITIPSTLMTNFNCVFRTFAGVTVTFIPGSGTTMDAPYGLRLPTHKMATLFKDGSTTTYILEGELIV
jgi:hypothetical protein